MAIEPVRYTVSRGPVRDIARGGGRILRPGPSGSYFFNKLVAEGEKYEELTVRKPVVENLKSTLQKENQRISDVLGEILPDPEIVKSLSLPVDELVAIMTDVGFSQMRERPRLYVRTTPPKSIIMRIDSTSFVVLSKQKAEADSIIAELQTSYKEIAEITKDFGLHADDFMIGSEIPKSLLKGRKDISAYTEQSPKNDFEKEAQEEISKFTSATLANTSINFISPNESFEYDTFMALSDSLTFDIELKDYETVREEIHSASPDSWKNRIILAISDKARRLEAVPTVVVRGFPDDTYKSVKELADSRKIDLMSANDYKTALPNLICSQLSRTALTRRGVYFGSEIYEPDASPDIDR